MHLNLNQHGQRASAERNRGHGVQLFVLSIVPVIHVLQELRLVVKVTKRAESNVRQPGIPSCKCKSRPYVRETKCQELNDAHTMVDGCTNGRLGG